MIRRRFECVQAGGHTRWGGFRHGFAVMEVVVLHGDECVENLQQSLRYLLTGHEGEGKLEFLGATTSGGDVRA
jgi:hypothetical protein